MAMRDFGGGLVFTWDSMEGATSIQDITDRCSNALSDVGASEEFCTFFADVLQCEHEINTTVQRIHQTLEPEKYDKDENKDPAGLLKGIQDLTRNYNIWKATINQLTQSGKEIPPLQVDEEKLSSSKCVKALCNLETKELNVKAGDEVTIVDASQPNRLKVRTNRGEEGYIPALSCLLPSPDKNALTATDRLRLQLLASWTQSVKKIQALLVKCVVTTSQQLADNWKSSIQAGAGKERVTRRFRRLTEAVNKPTQVWDLTKMHNSLFSLEKELMSWNVNGTDVTPFAVTIACLDKTVLCYQMFIKQWQLFRKGLEKSSRPLKVVDQWAQLRPMGNGRKTRYLEVKMTLDHTETVEEITYIKPDEWSHGSGGRDETVETDQITSTSQEESKRFVIKSVINPRNNLEISIQEAVRRGIVDPTRGVYVNIVTRDEIPIPEAMNNGLIKVEFVTSRKSAEATTAVGLITVKSRVDKRGYTISKVIDASTGERVDEATAVKRRILDHVNGIYINTSSKDHVPIDIAVQSGWIIPEYEEEVGEPEYETKTYAVNSVVDQRTKKKVPFYEAVKTGLINRRTGNYVNHLTGEEVYVADAIKRGFLKAKEVDDTSHLDIDAENHVVIENLDKIRKNVLKSVALVSAFKKAALSK